MNVTLDNVEKPAAGGIAVRWPTKTGYLYTLQGAPVIDNGPWNAVAGCVDWPGTGGVLSYTNAAPGANLLFYRLLMTTQP